MNNYRVYAEQTVCYALDIQADSLETALKLAEEADYDSWKEVDYYDWQVKDEYTTCEGKEAE